MTRRTGRAGHKDSQHIAPTPGTVTALVMATYGRHCCARDAQGRTWQVYSKGKKNEVAVGDWVELSPSGDLQGWVEHIQTRRNLLYRSDAFKSKVFAANVDQVLLVVAVSPPFSPELVARTAVACQCAGVPLTLVLNKCDLLPDDSVVVDALSECTHIPHGLLKVSAKTAPDKTRETLLPTVQGKVSLILGQSGMGKSTLVNLLIPDAQAATNDVSEALNSGKHTTTRTQWHDLPEGGALLDSPGFQAFGLAHLNREDIWSCFEDLAPFIKDCRFYNCQHVSEPGCGILAAIERGEAQEHRLHWLHTLLEEIAHARPT